MDAELLDRMPPHDEEAEKAVLGSILLDPGRMADIEAVITAKDFHVERNGRLFTAMRTLCRNGGRLDAQILKDHLRTTGQLDAVGGMAYLLEVATAVPYAAHADHYAEIVAKKAALRRIIHVGGDLLRRAYLEEDAGEILEGAERILAKIGIPDRTGPRPFNEIVEETIAAIDEAMAGKRGLGLPTGFADFDTFFGGLFPGELCVLAARPGVGKTAIATQIAEDNAAQGRVTYFASAEMAASEIVTRLLCGQAGVNSQEVRSGRLVASDVSRLVRHSNALAKARLYLDDRPGLSTAQIRRAATRVSREGLRLMVVDYLQLLQPADRRVSREEQVGSMARDLKCLARELEVPILCLCQLNRQAVNGPPDLHHLRESGAIEQHADMVMFLHREPESRQDGDPPPETESTQWIVRKNRNGEIGMVQLWWSRSLVGFDSQPKATVWTGQDELREFVGALEE